MRRMVWECCECGGEIEKEEDHYCINGELICVECAAQYAMDMMKPFRVEGVHRCEW